MISSYMYISLQIDPVIPIVASHLHQLSSYITGIARGLLKMYYVLNIDPEWPNHNSLCVRINAPLIKVVCVMPYLIQTMQQVSDPLANYHSIQSYLCA